MPPGPEASIPEQLATVRAGLTDLRRLMEETNQRQTARLDHHDTVLHVMTTLLGDIRQVLVVHAEDRTHTGDQYREATEELRAKIVEELTELQEMTSNLGR